MEEKAVQSSNFAFERSITKISPEIPKAIAARFMNCQEQIEAIKRLHWRKIYELMTPILSLGVGESFGELAV